MTAQPKPSPDNYARSEVMNFEIVADEIIALAQNGRGIRHTLITALQMAAGHDEARAAQDKAEGWEWAIVEVFGHRRHAGKTREEERFGAKLLRIDIPQKGNPAECGWQTVYYGGSSIFSFSLSDEASCLKINKPYESPSRLALTGPNGEASDDDVPF